MFGLARLSESVEAEPPSRAPSVPDTDSDALVAIDDVDTVLSVPLLFVVYVTPLDDRLDRFVMF